MPPGIAIIIPYRDRAKHLAETVPLLLAYDKMPPPWIIVVEQLANQRTHEPSLFNHGLLCNLGAALALTEHPHLPLICFHDVDMQPVDAVYSSEPGRPASLVGHVQKREEFEETPPGYFGGVVVFTPEDLATCGGYSNQYWGWGDEDLDLRMRCEWKGLEIDYRDSKFLHTDHPPTSVLVQLRENHKRLGKTQDRLIGPETDGIFTVPDLVPIEREDKIDDFRDDGTAVTTHVSYVIDRKQIEKQAEEEAEKQAAK